MEATTFRATTHDGLITVEVTFNSESDEYPPETVSEMCDILEAHAINIRMALQNPEIRNSTPIGGKES